MVVNIWQEEKAIILDKIGHNFASGMSGGICFIKNTKENLENINKEKNNQKLSLDRVVEEKKKLKLNIKKYTKQFNHLVLTSGRSSILPSYKVYMEYLNKSKEYGNDLKSSKSSGIKGTLSIEAWVDQVAKK